MRITDSHAHLNERELADFVGKLELFESLRVVSNSVDTSSSVRNLEIAVSSRSVVPFVGIHPEIFSRSEFANITNEELGGIVSELSRLVKKARGIGEVGLDPKYGRNEAQEYLLRQILSLAESERIPIAFHCRETASQILKLLDSFRLRQNLLFHWFSGSESELRRLHERGIYTSFGPSILFSKRMCELVRLSERNFILLETDSPTPYRSLFDGTSTPFMVSSVALKMASILGITFKDVCELTESNSEKYLLTQD